MAPRPSPDALNGVVIGLLSSLGSALLIGIIFVLVYFFKYTTSGRILLDRIGRPGEYDDEQAFAREEAEALETMDDMQRSEYLRAKGTSCVPASHLALPCPELPAQRRPPRRRRRPLRPHTTGLCTR